MATTLTLFNSFKSAISGKINLETDTLKVGLVTSAQTLTASGQAVYADITAEVANGNGYTTGGVTATTKTWSQTAGTAKLDFDDISWTASGAGFTSRQFFVYSNTATNKDLIGFGHMDNTPANVVLISGDTLTLTINASGLLTLA